MMPAMSRTLDYGENEHYRHESAGIKCDELNSEKRHYVALSKSNKRTYKEKDETERDIAQSNIKVKDFYYFYKKGNLWNETSKLSPQILKYSHENVHPTKSFKKTIRDLAQVEE